MPVTSWATRHEWGTLRGGCVSEVAVVSPNDVDEVSSSPRELRYSEAMGPRAVLYPRRTNVIITLRGTEAGAFPGSQS